jgi:hypothetical protein
MREIELEEEEELNQREKDLKKREKNLRIPKCKKKCNIILLHAIGSTLLYVVILISIYYNSNLYYILDFQFLCSSTVRLLVHPWVQRVLRIFAKRKGIFHFSLETTTHHFQVSDVQQDRAVPRESRVVAANVEQASGVVQSCLCGPIAICVWYIITPSVFRYILYVAKNICSLLHTLLKCWYYVTVLFCISS